ncbi:MAG: hypothetical protein PHD68_01880 [Rugosibacter sp.]|nr:hypothetical protein [Rugosibacter sp.]
MNVWVIRSYAGSGTLVGWRGLLAGNFPGMAGVMRRPGYVASRRVTSAVQLDTATHNFCITARLPGTGALYFPRHRTSEARINRPLQQFILKLNRTAVSSGTK